MSQIYVPTIASMPSIPTSFDTQDGSAVPTANVLIIDSFDSTENNDNGTTTKGGVAAGDPPGMGLPNEVSVYLTNRVTGTAITTDLTTEPLITFSMDGPAGTYFVYGNVQSYNIDVPGTSCFTFCGAYRTTGTTGTFVAGEFSNVFEDLLMEPTEANLDVNTIDNEIILEVTGLLGEEIHWNGLMEYRMVT